MDLHALKKEPHPPRSTETRAGSANPRRAQASLHCRCGLFSARLAPERLAKRCTMTPSSSRTSTDRHKKRCIPCPLALPLHVTLIHTLPYSPPSQSLSHLLTFALSGHAETQHEDPRSADWPSSHPRRCVCTSTNAATLPLASLPIDVSIAALLHDGQR